MSCACEGNARRLCKRMECTVCFDKSFASHPKAQFWDDEKNDDVEPYQVFKRAKGKYYFKCDKCFHTFDASLDNVSKNKNSTWCSYCENKKLCDDKTCLMCYEKSFASHPKAQFWNDEKNGNIKPYQVFRNANKPKYYFNCNICHHTFESTLNPITSQDNWCPYCANKLLCDDENCVACYEKSFASHPRAQFWNDKKNGDVKPRNVFKCTHEKYNFKCNNCPHTFNKALNNIVCKNDWCPYCANKKLCDDENCIVCNEKSFASHPKAKFWNDEKNGDVKPYQVFKSSGNKYSFNCDTCHIMFPIRLSTINNSNSWCPICKNKTEKKVYEYLLETYKTRYTIEYQFKRDWLRNPETNRFLPLDFALMGDNLKLIIEIDGRQHFEQVSNWCSPELTQARDIWKETQARNNGFDVLRLNQEDVWNDRIQWKETIRLAIYD